MCSERKTGGLALPQNCRSSSGCSRVFRPGNVTVCLQPQMKKYRCPWGVSTANHNILYFVDISRTRSLNTAKWPVESSNSLAGRGLFECGLPQVQCRWAFHRWGLPNSKRIPRPIGVQAVKMGQNGGLSLWRCGQMGLQLKPFVAGRKSQVQTDAG
jgi:hypothetical protein